MKRYLLGCLFLFSAVGEARPLPTIEQAQLRQQMLSQPRMASGFDFEGVVGLSNCSGSIVRFSHSRPQDRAMVLTNGHCIGRFPAPGRAVVGVASSREFTVLSRDGLHTIGRIRADLLMYATMTKTDMALYRLTSTYADIEQHFDVRALTLTEAGPDIGLGIQVLSGYWQRGYSCQVEKIVYQLKEGDWTNEESIRYSRPGCEVIGGTSGSPVVDPLNRTVVGVNNTGNESGDGCTENNPCEIDEAGNIEYQMGWSYAQQTAWIYSCVNSLGEMDLARTDCRLPH
ncbi:MAG: serine protease [Bdellovibrionales bacterium]